MANLYDFTERLKLLLYLNHRKSSVNTRHFDDNFQAVDDFARETDQKFVDQDTARNQLQADLLEIIRTNKTAFDNHAADQANPHVVTKLQVGLGNADNTSDIDKPVSTAQAKAIKAVQDDVTTHKQDTDNPHGVTKAQVGLGSADDTSDLDKPVSTAQAAAIKTVQDDIMAHKNSKTNPHGVTKSQVGLGNVPNVATNDQTPSYTSATTLAALVSGEKLSVAFGKLAKGTTDLISHLANKANPHGVTKAQIGLGSVDNTADKSKPVSTLQQDAIDAAMAQANAYTLQKIADLINGAPESMDTLKEVADALAANEDVMSALNAAIGTKASQAELDGHTGNNTIHITATERTNWNGAVNAKHSHANKALLDTYTQTEANLASAVSNKHSHGNKSVIDGITTALINAWNGAVSAQHSHSNKALLDSYTQTEVNLASAVSSKHTHSNKAVIDKITQAMLDTWDTVSGKAAAVHKHVKADITDFPASLKNPTALTLKLNGTAAATYDGSAAKEVNVTPAGIGAAVSDHVHNSINDSGDGKPTTFAYSKSGLETTSWVAAWSGKELRAISPANLLKTIGAAAASHTHTKAQISDFAHTHDDRYYTESEIDAKVKTLNDSISSKGGGDMVKSVYDTNNNGKVDKADLADTAPWSGITGKPSTFTPATHSHTKSQISDFPSSLPANGGTANYLNAIAIPANANLNSYTTPGFYYCAANATVTTMTNAPSGNAFFMIVGKHAGTFQMFVEYTVSSQKIYIRNYYGSWGSWQRIFTTANKPTLSELGAAATSHTHTKSQISDFPSSLPANGGNAATVGGFTVGVNVPANAKFTDTVYTHPAYTARSSGLYKITVDAKGHVSAVTAVSKADITALGIPGQDTNTVYTHPTTAGNKHIPSGGSSGQILRWSSDGTAVWGADNNTTYSAFKAATASAAGGAGLVPAPAAGKQTSFLRGDGTWAVPTNTTYGLATASANGLMSAADKAKMDKLKDESVIRNVTIATSAFVANTDDNAAQYPYCADYTVSGMTATCWANVNLSAASKALGVIEQGNTMAGKLRLYANAVPSAAIVIDNIVWKEVG